jgi:hypothetical protein
MTATYNLRGYHATTPERAANILNVGFNVSQNSYDWLGEGAYFYQDTAKFAWDWAKNRRKYHPIPNPAIVGVDIQATDILDLADVGWPDHIRLAYEQLEEERGERFQRAVDIQPAWQLGSTVAGPHPLDRLVIERAVSNLGAIMKIKAVRGAFFEGVTLFPGSHLFQGQHIQIAVRDVNILSQPWLVDRANFV